MRSEQLTFVFTAPYAPAAIAAANNDSSLSSVPHPGFDAVRFYVFVPVNCDVQTPSHAAATRPDSLTRTFQ